MEKCAFIFDTNKCVGCNACVAACSIENSTDVLINWREVNTHNKIRHPSLPVFHFSLACNHCEEAPCMSNCPSSAYARDKITGAVIHHAEACIGCTYCTWACPYDAPKFNPNTKIVEKCNFCVDRIKEEKKPACVAACPVGALDFDRLLLNNNDCIVPGFVNREIKPSIQLIPLRKEHSCPSIENLDEVNIDTERTKKWLPRTKNKVSLNKEWTLVLFTLFVAGLVSWQAAHLFGKVEMNLLPFVLVSILAIALTSLHIGKKFRMWRFIVNLKSSWLSREIFSFSAFLALTGLQISTENQFIGFIALAFGVFSLISVDMVYKLLQRKDGLLLHSGMVSFTAILFFAWLADFQILIELMILAKGTLYIWRKGFVKKMGIPYFPLLSLLRICCLFLPYLFYDMQWTLAMPIALLVIFMGEIIDRAEFYYESDVPSPRKELNELFLS